MLFSLWAIQSRVLQLAVPGGEGCRSGEGNGPGGPSSMSTLHGLVTLTKFGVGPVVFLLRSMRNGDGMFSIDLKDAYFQIPVLPDLPESEPYLRVCLKGLVYQFCALCFGLSTALQAFTSLCSSSGVGRAPFLLPERLAGHSGVEDPSAAASGSGSPVVQGFGIIVNWEKSDLQPSTCVQI